MFECDGLQNDEGSKSPTTKDSSGRVEKRGRGGAA